MSTLISPPADEIYVKFNDDIVQNKIINLSTIDFISSSVIDNKIYCINFHMNNDHIEQWFFLNENSYNRILKSLYSKYVACI